MLLVAGRFRQHLQYNQTMYSLTLNQDDDLKSSFFGDHSEWMSLFVKYLLVDDLNQLKPRFGIVKTYELWCREVGHRAPFRGEGRGQEGWHQWVSLEPVLGSGTNHQLQAAAAGPGSLRQKWGPLSGGASLAWTGTDIIGTIWLYKRINISSPISDTWDLFQL